MKLSTFLLSVATTSIAAVLSRESRSSQSLEPHPGGPAPLPYGSAHQVTSLKAERNFKQVKQNRQRAAPMYGYEDNAMVDSVVPTLSTFTVPNGTDIKVNAFLATSTSVSSTVPPSSEDLTIQITETVVPIPLSQISSLITLSSLIVSKSSIQVSPTPFTSISSVNQVVPAPTTAATQPVSISASPVDDNFALSVSSIKTTIFWSETRLDPPTASLPGFGIAPSVSSSADLELTTSTRTNTTSSYTTVSESIPSSTSTAIIAAPVLSSIDTTVLQTTTARAVTEVSFISTGTTTITLTFSEYSTSTETQTQHSSIASLPYTTPPSQGPLPVSTSAPICSCTSTVTITVIQAPSTEVLFSSLSTSTHFGTYTISGTTYPYDDFPLGGAGVGPTPSPTLLGSQNPSSAAVTKATPRPSVASVLSSSTTTETKTVHATNLNTGTSIVQPSIQPSLVPFTGAAEKMRVDSSHFMLNLIGAAAIALII